MPDDHWLVVGLGNPTDEYDGTRHNLGADVVRVLAARGGHRLARHRRMRCATADVRLGEARVTLAIPEGYMNLSGGPVQAALSWLKLPTDRLIVVHDDIDLPFAAVRLKRGGGTGGHNGLKDVERALGTPDWYRVRIGVGRPPGRMDPAAWVLRRFSAEERPEIDVSVEHAADAVTDLVTIGLEPAQQRHHTAS